MNKEKLVANIENILTTMYLNHISIINMLLIYFFMYSVKSDDFAILIKLLPGFSC